MGWGLHVHSSGPSGGPLVNINQRSRGAEHRWCRERPACRAAQLSLTRRRCERSQVRICERGIADAQTCPALPGSESEISARPRGSSIGFLALRTWLGFSLPLCSEISVLSSVTVFLWF